MPIARPWASDGSLIIPCPLGWGCVRCTCSWFAPAPVASQRRPPCRWGRRARTAVARGSSVRWGPRPPPQGPPRPRPSAAVVRRALPHRQLCWYGASDSSTLLSRVKAGQVYVLTAYEAIWCVVCVLRIVLYMDTNTGLKSTCTHENQHSSPNCR